MLCNGAVEEFRMFQDLATEVKVKDSPVFLITCLLVERIFRNEIIDLCDLG